MLWAEHPFVDCERLAEELLGLVIVASVPEDHRELPQVGAHFRVLLTIAPAVDRQRLAQQRLGLFATRCGFL